MTGGRRVLGSVVGGGLRGAWDSAAGGGVEEETTVHEAVTDPITDLGVCADEQRAAIDAITVATTPDELEAAADLAERLGVLDLPIRLSGWLPDTYVSVRRWELSETN